MHNVSKSTARVALVSLIFCGCVGLIQGQQQTENEAEEHVDHYSTEVVRALLEQPEGISVSWLDKRQARLGDRASIALLKLFTEQELLAHENLERSLRVIRGAFSCPSLIEIPEDKEPKVTLFVLQNLARRTNNASLKAKILETITYVQRSMSLECP